MSGGMIQFEPVWAVEGVSRLRSLSGLLLTTKVKSCPTSSIDAGGEERGFVSPGNAFNGQSQERLSARRSAARWSCRKHLTSGHSSSDIGALEGLPPEKNPIRMRDLGWAGPWNEGRTG